jgi:hypothetical protein
MTITKEVMRTRGVVSMKMRRMRATVMKAAAVEEAAAGAAVSRMKTKECIRVPAADTDRKNVTLITQVVITAEAVVDSAAARITDRALASMVARVPAIIQGEALAVCVVKEEEAGIQVHHGRAAQWATRVMVVIPAVNAVVPMTAKAG